MNTNTPLTLYNRVVTGSVVTYFRHVIPEVSWSDSEGANVIQFGAVNLAANKATIYVPFEVGVLYLDPKAWIALVDKTGRWTFQYEDIIIKGEVTDEISPSFTVTQLTKKYDHVLNIKKIDFKDMGSVRMWHWKIGAS